ncbi:MAG TPA: VTT domain-containing protein [Conexivisphaerales archaeon]|nr:VTT domain-containing protein [Conexivisphaerales archaeon]
MDPLSYLFHLITNLYDLNGLILAYGPWVYLVLFLFIFGETGFVLFPFLPGDSILFIAGTFAAAGSLDVSLLVVVLAIAAVAGDSVNYSIGRYIGPRAFHENVRFLKKEYLDRAHVFFERHGGKAIVLARFAPIIRTFVPFVAGIGSMRYRRFLMYNVVGGIGWVALFVLTGYFFGNIAFVKENFTLVIYAIVAISLLPAVLGFIQGLRKRPTDR